MKESLNTALVKKADQIRNATDILVSKTRDWQLIKQYLCGRLADMQLTAEQEEKLKRYQFIYNQLVSGKYTEQDVINQVVRIYNVGLPQAYEDKNATQEIFCSVLSINKRFEQKNGIRICQRFETQMRGNWRYEISCCISEKHHTTAKGYSG